MKKKNNGVEQQDKSLRETTKAGYVIPARYKNITSTYDLQGWDRNNEITTATSKTMKHRQHGVDGYATGDHITSIFTYATGYVIVTRGLSTCSTTMEKR